MCIFKELKAKISLTKYALYQFLPVIKPQFLFSLFQQCSMYLQITSMLTELEAVLSWFWIRLLALQVYSAASDFCMAENVKVSPDTEEMKRKDE